MKNLQKPTCIVFDVNETLLDMKPLKRKVNEALSSKNGFKVWFGMLLQYSLVDNSTGIYHPFPDIAKATLDLAATSLSTEISEKEKVEIISLIVQLPPHKDVIPGLKLLRNAGLRLFALTNSPVSTLTKQLAFAKLNELFEKALSIDEVKKYKPAPETYRYAAEAAGEKLSNMMMVAAHGWDIAGATAAGMQTAFVSRKGHSTYLLSPEPTLAGKDIFTIAQKILSNH